jgi:hypothetical protein
MANKKKYKIQWTLRTVPINDVFPNPDNPRIFREKEMKELRDSMTKFGVAEPLVANPDGMLIGGHARLELLRQDGAETVDVYYPDKALNKKQADELMVRLNKNVAGVFDEEKLNLLFTPEELFEIGFERYELGLEIPDEKPFMPPDVQVEGEQEHVGDYLILQFESEESCNKARALLNVMAPSRIVFEQEFWKHVEAYTN